MTLSKRASAYLQKLKRETSVSTEADIRKAFATSKAPVFEPLIEFELKYGGYIFFAVLAPIKFSLLKENGAYVDFQESGKQSPQYFFDLADTLYQMQFFLDEEGKYYEDYEVKHASFEKLIEDISLRDEINLPGDYEMLFRQRKLKADNIAEKLNLELIPEASDQYTVWYKSEFLYISQWNGLTTIIAPKNYPGKDMLLAL